jgi:hypothetical protein
VGKTTTLPVKTNDLRAATFRKQPRVCTIRQVPFEELIDGANLTTLKKRPSHSHCDAAEVETVPMQYTVRVRNWRNLFSFHHEIGLEVNTAQRDLSLTENCKIGEFSFI